MAWPTPQDYNEALQSPKLNFDDPELKTGHADVTALGLPRPITGGFASVYRIRCGAKSWAVRCFLRDFPDHQERYAAIGRHLATANLPYTVGFHFLPKGLRIRGKWYPILKMEWIDGETFADVLKANARNPQATGVLAERWLDMVAALQKHQIAHGDLQHGNIVIARGDFKLIDYDGMYVPPLAGRNSHEVGHRNYQHPRRSETHFGPYLDNFSSWTIYLTLLVLSIDPTFWSRYGSGDENLLFKREDFEEPRFSRVMRAIEQIKDDRIQRLMSQFRSFLTMDVDKIPSPVDGLKSRQRTAHRKPATQAVADWWNAIHPKPVPVSESPAVSPRPLEDAPTSLPQLPLPFQAPVEVERPPEPRVDAVAFDNSFAPERVTLFSYLLLLLGMAGAMWEGAATVGAGTKISAASGVVVLIFTLSRYLASQPLKKKLHLWSAVQRERTVAAGLRMRMNYAGGRVVRSTRSGEVHGLERREQRLREKEARGIRAVEADLQRILDELKAQRAVLQKAESEKIASRLAVLQNRHDELATFELSIATIPGFGPAMKKRLWDAGIRTAADFYAVHLPQRGRLGFSSGPAAIEISNGTIVPVEGLGTKKAEALAAWRKAIETRIQQGTPQSLPKSEEAAVRAPFVFQQETIILQEKHATEIALARIELIRRKAQGSQQAVRNRLREVRVQSAAELQNLELELDSRRAALLEQRKQVHAVRRRLGTYREIRYTRYLRRSFGI